MRHHGPEFQNTRESDGPAAGASRRFLDGPYGRTVIMCAEAVPWRCHRSLIADALLARGVEVEDIMSKTARKPHRFTSFAKVEGTRVTYPGLMI